jgi:hypothetical protein
MERNVSSKPVPDKDSDGDGGIRVVVLDRMPSFMPQNDVSPSVVRRRRLGDGFEHEIFPSSDKLPLDSPKHRDSDPIRSTTLETTPHPTLPITTPESLALSEPESSSLSGGSGTSSLKALIDNEFDSHAPSPKEVPDENEHSSNAASELLADRVTTKVAEEHQAPNDSSNHSSGQRESVELVIPINPSADHSNDESESFEMISEDEESQTSTVPPGLSDSMEDIDVIILDSPRRSSSVSIVEVDPNSKSGDPRPSEEFVIVGDFPVANTGVKGSQDEDDFESINV